MAAKRTAKKPAAKDETKARLASLEQAVADRDAKLAKLQSELEVARSRNPPAAAPPKSLAEMAAPPSDPLEANTYAYNMLIAALHDAAKDPKISDRERRKEMRTIAASAAKLFPKTRIHRAEQIILQNQAELEQKSRMKTGAKLEKLPRSAGVKEPHA